MGGMIARLDHITLDASDIERLASFYADLTGWRVTGRSDNWITITTDSGQKLGFQRSPDHVAPQWPGQQRPQQGHLDLVIDDIEAHAERAETLGAVRLAHGPNRVTLADPAGHPFDLFQRDGVGPVVGLFAVTLDAPDAAALARFYAGILGMKVTLDGPEGSLISGDGPAVMFQQVAEYNPPRWPDPAYPPQVHFDLDSDDNDAARRALLAYGATTLPGGSDAFQVYADPAGHPFCL
jgi:catechol 2,3-dioxygenase-like lactoylglutathione lyase family enzyme